MRPRHLAAFALATFSAVVSAACGRGSGSQALPSATPSAEAKPRVADIRIQQGARLYERYCQLCHAKDATGYAADNAPSLVSKTFLESAPDALIAAGIRMGRPGTAMAAYGRGRGGPLDEQDISSIVLFLRSKGPSTKPLPAAGSNGDAQRGAQLYEQHCQSCHATPTTRGNAPSLFNAELLNAASPAFLQYAIVNGRPPTPMPPFQGKLAAQDVTDIVTWLWTFKPAQPTAPVASTVVPPDLPMVINPKGKRPAFTLRDDRFVPAAQVKQALDAKQRVIIIDARPPSDWLQFHIPGAVSLSYYDASQLDRVPNDGTWVIAYCACPHHASGEVVDALRARKYPNTAVMDEGILFWRDKGYPLEGASVPGHPGPVASSKPVASAPAKPAPAAPSAVAAPPKP